MSSFTHIKAKEIIAFHYTNDPYIIAEKQNIEVIEKSLSGRLKELYFGDYIILNQNLTFPKKRHYLAHALGHHFLHTGNRFFFAKMRYLQNSKEESQAEEFAAYLLIPDNILTDIAHWPINELADYFQVSPRFIQFRLGLIDQQDHFKTTTSFW